VELVSALAYLTIPAMVGPVVGPPLGGFITTAFDWRWIFFINIPIGLLGIGLATLFIPTSASRTRRPSTVSAFSCPASASPS
jgi:MFS family permease